MQILGFARGGANGKIREGLKMAWTWSAPRRGTVAATAVLANRQQAFGAITASFVRGDASRNLSIACAAVLTAMGGLAPHLSPVTLTALLFVAGAAFVVFAILQPSPAVAFVRHSNPAASQNSVPETAPSPAASPAFLLELLQPRETVSACDRAAFARLTAHMSHELRTPLNAIIGFSELMSNEVFGPLGSSCYAAYARDIHTSGMNLLKSAEDALAITTLLTAPERQHRASITNAASAALEALAFHSPALALRGITATCTIDIDAEILADAQAARQLLINLISDAAQLAENGASLSLASRQDHGHIEILISLDGQRQVLRGSNSGFAMLLARTLAELSSAQIIEDAADETCGGSHVAVRFQCVTQNDFFSRTR